MLSSPYSSVTEIVRTVLSIARRRGRGTWPFPRLTSRVARVVVQVYSCQMRTRTGIIATNVIMPKTGTAIEEGTLVRWLSRTPKTRDSSSRDGTVSTIGGRPQLTRAVAAHLNGHGRDGIPSAGGSL